MIFYITRTVTETITVDVTAADLRALAEQPDVAYDVTDCDTNDDLSYDVHMNGDGTVLVDRLIATYGTVTGTSTDTIINDRELTDAEDAEDEEDTDDDEDEDEDEEVPMGALTLA